MNKITYLKRGFTRNFRWQWESRIPTGQVVSENTKWLYKNQMADYIYEKDSPMVEARTRTYWDEKMCTDALV
jgi:hypothetical protein